MLAVFAGMVANAVPAAAADCSFGVGLTSDGTCTIPPGVTAIQVDLASTAAETRPTLPSAAGGAGVSIRVWKVVTPGETLEYKIGYSLDVSTCASTAPQPSEAAATGSIAAVNLPASSAPVVAGAGGAPGCTGDVVGASGLGAGGAAGVPVGTGTANGSNGANGGTSGGDTNIGGGGGTASQGVGGTGVFSQNGYTAPDSRSGSRSTGVSYLSYGGGQQNAGVKAGNGGSGYTGGGGGGGSAGTTGTIPDAAGGGGGSSHIDPAWTFVSASARTSTTGASVTITNYTSAATEADLSGLTASAGSLSPAFASGTTLYTMSVDNDVATTTITPTVSQSGATVTVNGSSVTSGSASSSINLAVGITSVDVVVTALDGTTTNTYTIQFTRAPAPPVSGEPGPTAEGNRQLTVANPISVSKDVRSGSASVGESVDGSTTGLIALRNSTNSGWSLTSGSGKTTVNSNGSSGGAVPLAADGSLQVTPRGTIDVSSGGYKPGTLVYVYAIPRNQAANGSGTVGSIYLAAFTVNADGTISGTVTIPGGMSAGDYVLQINGISATEQIRSINLGMNVIGAVADSSVNQLVEAAFFQPKSSDLSVNGRLKLEALVSALPVGAAVTQVLVVGVSEFDQLLDKNVSLATKRADEVARFLNERQVGDSQTTLRFIEASDKGSSKRYAFDSEGDPVSVEGAEALEISQPVQSSTGKSLSSVRVVYQSAP